MPETLFLLGKNLVRAQLLGDFVFWELWLKGEESLPVSKRARLCSAGPATWSSYSPGGGWGPQTCFSDSSCGLSWTLFTRWVFYPEGSLCCPALSPQSPLCCQGPVNVVSSFTLWSLSTAHTYVPFSPGSMTKCPWSPQSLGRRGLVQVGQVSMSAAWPSCIACIALGTPLWVLPDVIALSSIGVVCDSLWSCEFLPRLRCAVGSISWWRSQRPGAWHLLSLVIGRL